MLLDTADISLLASAGLVLSAFGTYNYYALIRKEATKAQKYRLYKIRDDLIYLVAQEKLAENDHLFVLFYGLTNHLIKTTKESLSLKSFVSAVSSADRNPADEEQVRKIVEELRNKDPEVGKVLFEFYRTIGEIVVESSFVLRMGFNLQQLWSQLRPLVTYLWPLQTEAYQIWRRYDHAATSLEAT